MASVSVLYVNDEVVGPHLELLRNICEPESNSRPHVTVRYFERLSVPAEYFDVRVTHIDLLEADSFGLEANDRGPNRTVYIRCESDELVPLEHKPHFPASDFHITIYDGQSGEFARRLLATLRTVEWGFRLRLPYDTTLARVEIKPRKPGDLKLTREYRPVLKRIFRDATSQELSWSLVNSLTSDQRLAFARDICSHLESVTRFLPRVPHVAASVTQLDPIAGGLVASEPEVHLTPPELANEIAKYALTFLDAGSPIRFGDPAVGTGAFYSALLQVTTRDRIESAVGVDVSPRQVAAAQRRWGRRGMTVMHGDYLHMGRLPHRNLVLANPPYLRHQEIPPTYKHDLRSRSSVTLGMNVNGRCGLYVYFMLLAHEWLEADAISAWLVPSEFMQTMYGAAVREYLTHKVQLLRIHRFSADNPQFENAKVLPAVVVYRNRAPIGDDVVMLSSGGSLLAPLTTQEVKIQRLRRDRNWALPLRGAAAPDTRGLHLRDLFSVRRGIATGANDFFIIERCDAARLGIPDIALRPVLPKVKSLASDIIEGAEDGYPIVTPQLCLLDCDLPESEIRLRFPRLMEYLESAKERGILERNLVRSRRPWYRQERRDPAPFVCTYMGRGRNGSPPLRFLWNKSAAVATNTYLLLYPHDHVRKLMRDMETTAAIFGLLKTAAQRTVAEHSRVHAGGLHKIEPSELLDVRLPSPPPWILRATEARLNA